jgi:hypothetical protein
LDVVVVTLNASAAYRGRDGSKDQIEEDAARRVLQCMSRLLARNGRSMCADECLFWGKSGRAADITAKTDFDPRASLREHSRDLPIAALVTDWAMKTWYHPPLHE